MGQVCSRDDDVDKQAGNAPATVGHQNTGEPPKMKQAAPIQEPPKAEHHAPPKEESPKHDNVTKLAKSEIEDVHINSKNLEPWPKMNQMNVSVQRKYDSLPQIRAENFNDLKQKYNMSQASGQIVKDKTTGSTYQGQMFKGVPHGWGRCVLADGGLIEGFFEEGNPIGYVRRIAAPNGAGYEGQFANNQPNGKGTSFDEKCSVDCNTWINGQAQGHQVIKNLSGQVILEGALNGGKKNGKCIWFDEKTKTKYVGEFKDDFLEGRGTKQLENGQTYEGDFRKGVEEGKGTLSFVDGRKFEGPFVGGKANGAGVLITDKGARVNQTWKDGKRQN